MASSRNGANKTQRPIAFLVPGQRAEQPFAPPAGGAARGGAGTTVAATPGALKGGVRLSAQRGGGELHRLEAMPGEDVVALHIAGGPVLWLHPETARDLLRAQSRDMPTRAARGARAEHDEDATEVTVAAQLRWHGLERAAPTRGWMGDVVLAAIEVFTGRSGLKEKAVDLVASQALRLVDGQVDAGLYSLEPTSLEARLKGSGRRLATLPAADGPALVLIHGTFVETTSTFKKLWTEHPRRVRELFARYGGHIYALDHPTMGASPIANALTLVQGLPKGRPVRLHLLTHSRGGLVAEVLARMAHQKKIGAADLAFFPGDAWVGQRMELQTLAREVAERDIRIERVVRVACPARGTLLASKRLDAYLSVLKWTLELVRVPVAPVLVDFLAEVARRRADPTQIPGIAAMMPDAPLLRWLNGAPVPIDGQLFAVSGDLRGEGVGSWVKTLLADAFYWGDNDIVVHTRAMYAGAPRNGGASYLLDQGGDVTHFNYFANERTAAAVVDALPGAPDFSAAKAVSKAASGTAAALPPGYAPIGPLSWSGKDASGQRGTAVAGRGRRDKTGAAADAQRPAVFVLPGILGSHLRRAQDRLWVAFRIVAGLGRLTYRADGTDQIAEDGPIGLIYDDLVEFLGRTHEVRAFGFDWRRPIEEEARRLARAIDAAVEARKASGQPVRVLAHSMGGLVARTVQIESPATWARWMAHDGARLVMLGTPNGGSWAPMQVLSADDSIGNLLAVVGAPFADGRPVMAAMPGFLQLQAGLTDERLGLHRAERWRQLAEDDFAQLQSTNWWHRAAGESMLEKVYRWGVPPQEVLDRAVALRRCLDQQVERDLPGFADKLRLVVGSARFTPDGFEVGDDGFVYLDAVDGGDGRVPLRSALLPGVRTWTTDIEHGSLASKDRVFGAYLDLLETGDTAQLRQLPAHAAQGAPARGTRAEATGAAPVQHVRSRPSRQVARPVPPSDERDLALSPMRTLAGSAADADRDAGAGASSATGTGRALVVAVHNGDLSFVRQPLMIGHYCSLRLTGAEAVLDGMLGGSMSASLAGGLYPEACGTVQVFGNTHRDANNPWAEPHPRAAIVVGLGDEGQLTAAKLTESVRQGALAWAQRVAETPGGTAATLELAATLMGSGGVGVQAGDAARAIAEGVHEANQRLAANGWPVVTELKLIELFLDRASEAWRALRMLQAGRPDLCELAPAITTGPGARRRVPDSGYRGADYDLVRVTGGAEDGRIEFSLDTRRARTEVRAEQTQGTLVRELVGRAAQHGQHDAAFGRTLFQLLVPSELEPFLGGTAQMVIDLDERTAPIPWELLDTATGSSADPRPWALRSRLLRKLRTADFAAAPPRDANADDAVLVVGEPLAPPDYAPLPGARAEAEAVFASLTGTGGIGSERVTALFGPSADAPAVINALLARRWRIVHVAGHGEAPDAKQPAQKPNGVVLSGGVFLGPNEIRKMRAVPELVFVNCCHLAGHDARSTLVDRPKFAAGVADALIRLGVRCVVAAGWAVDDEPAQAFAEAFYERLLEGAPFIEAVGAAREKAWRADPGGKTWAAYQCYGDPHWTYRERTGDAQGARARAPALTGPAAEYDNIASPVGLALTLEDMAIVQRSQPGRDRAAMRDRLRHLQSRFADPAGPHRWGDIGAVAESFGLAWESAGDRDEAIAWYERAVAAEDASGSMKAAQSLNNLRARRAELRARGDTAAAKSTPAAGKRGRAATVKPSAAAKPDGTFDLACGEITAARDELQRLAAQHPSVEGHSLVGSASKRLALLYRRAGRAGEARAALLDAIAAYGQAERIAMARGAGDLLYPALNRIAAELVLKAGDKATVRLDPDMLAAVRKSLSDKHTTDPDFWSATAFVELDLYEAVAARKLAERKAALIAGLADVRQRRDDASQWESVATQADFVLGALVDEGASGAEVQAAQDLRETLARYSLAHHSPAHTSAVSAPR